MQVQRIADVIQTQRVTELRIHQTDHMAPGAEGPRLAFDPGFTCQLRDEMGGNEVAQRFENRKVAPGWFALVFVFHSCPLTGSSPQASPLFSTHSAGHGMLLNPNRNPNRTRNRFPNMVSRKGLRLRVRLRLRSQSPPPPPHGHKPPAPFFPPKRRPLARLYI